jgi:alcohol dehydrogenase class IV
MLITTAVVTPAQAITDATDRSKSPEARQNSIPQATIPDMEMASPAPSY